MPLKRLFTFDQLPPDVQKKALERQGTCAHRIFTHPREHLVGAEGTFCHEGSRGFVENRVCIECGVNRGIYYTSVWKDGVPYELKYGETLRSKGLIAPRLASVAVGGCVVLAAFDAG